MQAEQTIEQATQLSVVQAVQTMQTSAVAASKIVADTTNAICKQLSRCETIDELSEVIRKLREASAC